MSMSFFDYASYCDRVQSHKSSSFYDADGAMFYGSKHGTVLADKVEDCYKDIHEMVQEFREKYGKYLPDDFDYETHMVLFWGANRG